MSLTAEDLTQIRSIFREENKSIHDEIQALHNDIKEIYDELAAIKRGIKQINNGLDNIERKVLPDKEFARLTTEEKLLRINTELLTAAKELGVELPR